MLDTLALSTGGVSCVCLRAFTLYFRTVNIAPPFVSSLSFGSKLKTTSFARALRHVHAKPLLFLERDPDYHEASRIQSNSCCCPETDAPDRLYGNNDQRIPQVFKKAMLHGCCGLVDSVWYFVQGASWDLDEHSVSMLSGTEIISSKGV